MQTVRAYLLKEDFQQFWTYNSPAWAGKFLDFWCQQVMRSRIEPMKKVARTLREHRELLNCLKVRKEFSSGVVESLNNKAKVVMRRSYGLRTFRVLEFASYHSLAKLPEPTLTHKFFWRVSFLTCAAVSQWRLLDAPLRRRMPCLRARPLIVSPGCVRPSELSEIVPLWFSYPSWEFVIRDGQRGPN